MKGLEKHHIERFCRKHSVDVHEIDDTLTYAENKEHLSEFTMPSLEDLAKDAKSAQARFDSLSLGERYGDIQTSGEKPLIIISCGVRYSQRMISIVKLRLKPYRKHVDMTHRGYLIVRGQRSEISEILGKIEDIPHEVLGSSTVYDWERLQGKWQYHPTLGWVRKLDAVKASMHIHSLE